MTFLKAPLVILLASISAASLHSGLMSYSADSGFVFIGANFGFSAFALYRLWFSNRQP